MNTAILLRCGTLLPALLLCACTLSAQTTTTTETDQNVHGSDLHVNPVMGFNASLDTTAQHNSATGWAEIVTPDVSYRFNQHLSLSASVPWYLALNGYVPTTVKGTTTYPLKPGRNLLADANLAGHLEAAHNDSNYLLVGILGLPTGNADYGLSAKTTTFNVTNHFDYQKGIFDPDIELGIGNSSTLANQTVRRAYSAVGPIANFQVGTGIDLPWYLSLDLEAYEDLPIGNQKVYGTVTSKNKKGKTTTKQVLQGEGAAEDNGFLAELDYPLGRHVRLAGTYQRSLVQALDTASVGLTWTFRAPTITRSH